MQLDFLDKILISSPVSARGRLINSLCSLQVPWLQSGCRLAARKVLKRTTVKWWVLLMCLNYFLYNVNKQDGETIYAQRNGVHYLQIFVKGLYLLSRRKVCEDQGLRQDFKNACPKQQFQNFCPSRFSFLATSDPCTTCNSLLCQKMQFTLQLFP